MQLFRRYALVSAVVALVALLMACGPSAAQVKEAREARYKAASNVVFTSAVDAVAATYKVAQADAAGGIITTEPRWYEKDGTFEDKALGDDGVVAEDGSILLSYEVRLTGADGLYQTIVIPHAQQVRSGYAAPFPLPPDDPSMPGWINSKTDDLYVAIHGKLKSYAVK